MAARANTTDMRAVFLDLSGVLYDGDQVITGAPQTVARLRECGLVLRFVTNTATNSRAQILGKLRDLGFQLDGDELFTAPDAALAYLRQHQLTPYTLVHANIRPEFEWPGEADAVVLGDARDELKYTNLNRAFHLIKTGCPLIAIGDNKYFRDGDILCLDAGAFVHALAWAADVTPVIMGKPSVDFFAQVVASTGLSPEQCLMVGDDVLGDVEGALKAGLQARLVRTGKYQPGDEDKLQPPATCITNLQALIQSEL